MYQQNQPLPTFKIISNMALDSKTKGSEFDSTLKGKKYDIILTYKQIKFLMKCSIDDTNICTFLTPFN